jgi:hypothetical protein
VAIIVSYFGVNYLNDLDNIKSEKSAPEKAFLAYVNRVNERDYRGVLNTTIYYYLSPWNQSNPDLWLHYIENNSAVTYEEINSTERIDIEKMNESQLSQCGEQLKWMEDHMHAVIVLDYCIVHYQATVNDKGHIYDVEQYIICFNVDNKWYVDDIIGSKFIPA